MFPLGVDAVKVGICRGGSGRTGTQRFLRHMDLEVFVQSVTLRCAYAAEVGGLQSGLGNESLTIRASARQATTISSNSPFV